MKNSAVGALGALLLATTAAPALAGGYYDAGPQTPGWRGDCPPQTCPPPGPPSEIYEGVPPAPDQLAPPDYDQGPPPADYGPEPGPAAYGDEYYGGPAMAGGVGPGMYYDDGGALVDEGPGLGVGLVYYGGYGGFGGYGGYGYGGWGRYRHGQGYGYGYYRGGRNGGWTGSGSDWDHYNGGGWGGHGGHGHDAGTVHMWYGPRQPGPPQAAWGGVHGGAPRPEAPLAGPSTHWGWGYGHPAPMHSAPGAMATAAPMHAASMHAPMHAGPHPAGGRR